MAQELMIDHLHGSNRVTEKIRKAMYNAAKEFVYIGFLLYEVQEYKYYEEAGFGSVYEYAEFELGFKRTSTKNFIAIAREFGTSKDNYHGRIIETQTMNLQPKYEKFNYSQLVELLAMSNSQRAKAKPDMTVKQLRLIKREEPDQESSGQTSDQEEKVFVTINGDYTSLKRSEIRTLADTLRIPIDTRCKYTIIVKKMKE